MRGAWATARGCGRGRVSRVTPPATKICCVIDVRVCEEPEQQHAAVGGGGWAGSRRLQSKTCCVVDVRVREEPEQQHAAVGGGGWAGSRRLQPAQPGLPLGLSLIFILYKEISPCFNFRQLCLRVSYVFPYFTPLMKFTLFIKKIKQRKQLKVELLCTF